MRLFVAISLPDAFREPLRALMERIGGPVRWTPPEQVHLTLRFLGDVPRDGIVEIEALLPVVARRHRPFELRVAGTGAFPNMRRPRVLWVGVGPPQGVERLVALRDSLDAGLEALGFPHDSRPFRPHLTIGRVRSRRAAGGGPRMPRLPAVRFEALPLPADGIDLMESRLGAGGPRYRRLLRAVLGEGGEAGPGEARRPPHRGRAPL